MGKENIIVEKQRPERVKLPLSIKPPIVTDALTQGGVKPFLDFIAMLEVHNNKEAAAAESKRLSPYFEAMSNYFGGMLDKLDPKSKLGRKAKGLRALTTSTALSGLFNKMSEYAHNTILSEVVIFPDNIKKGPAGHIFSGYHFDVGFKYLGHGFNFGFLQVYADGVKETATNSTTIGTFTLDHKMLDAVSAHQPEQMLRDFQAVMSFVNHDPLHHYTSTEVDSKIAGGFGESGKIYRWMEDMEDFRNEVFINYEDWAHIGHERTLLAPENAAKTIKEIMEKLDSYFDALERIGIAIAKTSKGQAHSVVDYFSTVMAHNLTRLFPLDHPVMDYALARMEKADPDPARAYKNVKKYFGAKMEDPERIELSLHQRYLDAGTDLFGSGAVKDRDYKQLKLLTLTSLAFLEARPHAPMEEMEEDAVRDRATLDMIVAVAKTTKFKVK